MLAAIWLNSLQWSSKTYLIGGEEMKESHRTLYLALNYLDLHFSCPAAPQRPIWAGRGTQQVPLASKAIWSLCPQRNKSGPFISSLLCTLWCRCLVTFDSVAHSEQILIHSGGDLSLSVVFADLPLALFSASGGKRFPLGEGGWMVALLVGVHVQVFESLMITTTAPTPNLTPGIVAFAYLSFKPLLSKK